MPDLRFLERVWWGTDLASAVARAALWPVERVYAAAVGARGLLYDAGWLPAHRAAIPTVSVGNAMVGGTGKTPVAAWIARRLKERGSRPAIVLRGYGDDEPTVHRVLNPDVAVIVDADRVRGIARAAADGADIAVLDDAFQHRRARRAVDLVLISADRWTDNRRLLPAGPWRESLGSVRRATMVIVTRKAASEEMIDAVYAKLARVAPSVPRVAVCLALRELVQAAPDDAHMVNMMPLSALAGRRVHLIVGVADPQSLVRQLEALGARVDATVYPDHHGFGDEEIARFLHALTDDALAVCTLKDAVKLRSRWPRQAPPVWYVSQQLIVERGVGGLERLLDDLRTPAEPIQTF